MYYIYLEIYTLDIRGDSNFYFPLKIEADPASFTTLTNSVSDCTMYYILVSIFGLGRKLSSSGPGPSPISISNIKTQKRTRADMVIQMHPPPPTNFLTSIQDGAASESSSNQEGIVSIFSH